jgi:hypothetical protein
MMRNLEVIRVEAQATAGAVHAECAREAAILALTENRVVTFTHNARLYAADPRQLIGAVMATQKCGATGEADG